MITAPRIARLLRRTVATLVVAAAIALPLAGCARQLPTTPVPTPTTPKSAGPVVTITDDASRTVTIEGVPQRIVSLAPANTEIVYSLGLFERLVGVTTFDDYPAQVKDVAKVGDFQTPNLEAIAAVKPDLILVTGGVQADIIGKLEGTGARVLVVDPKTLDGVFSSIGSVAKVLGATAKGDEVVAKMKADLADISKRIASDKAKRVFVEIGWNPLFTAGKGTLLDDLITKAGGINVVAQNDYVGYSVEQLVRDQPEVYLGTKSSLGDPLGVAERPGYSALKAIQAGSIYALDDNLVSRPGPRVVEGVLAIAKILHPDAFK